MSYVDRVDQVLRNPSEKAFIQLICETVSPDELIIKAKERAICGLAQFFADTKQPEKIKTIASNYNQHFSTFSKPRLAKIVKSLVDYIALVPRTERLQIELSEYLIQWCIKEKRTYLKNRIELKLAALYLEVAEPEKSIKIIDPILIEVRKADDKLLLVELYLLESKINYFIKNYAKAKASLTASRANANNVYCQPSILAEIDLMSGVLYAHDQDYKTAYSYFYESLEPLMGANDPRTVNCFKYMILCKIMSNNKDDVNSLLNGKFGLKFSVDSHVQAIKQVAEAHFSSSIVALSNVFKKYNREIQGDEVVNNHTKLLYDNLLEKNLFKIIDSYTRVDINYIARKLSLDDVVIERKLSEMILDKKITGTLDQSNGCLIIYHEQKKDILYNGAGQVIENLLSTVEKLSEASLTLKKQH